MVRDLQNVLGKFEKLKKKYVLENENILPANKKLINGWLIKKEDELKSRKGRERADELRWSKTINKYVLLLRNIGEWFDKPFNKLTEKELKGFYERFEKGEIKCKTGKPFARSTRKDYYNKVFKSGFGEFCGIQEKCQKIMILENSEDEEVKFFEYEDLNAMINSYNNVVAKTLLCLSFDLCLRVGETLNLLKSDFERRYNRNTKQNYYYVRIRKECTKSKKERRISTLLPETTKLLDRYLKTIKNSKDLLFTFSYGNALKIVQRAAQRANVVTKPDGKPVAPHDYRKSGATHWLKKGMTIDKVKARLGHKPSSRVIDRYVSYLGLDQEEIVTEIQQGDIKDLENAYKETRELLAVQVENNKQVQEDMGKLQKQHSALLEHFDKRKKYDEFMDKFIDNPKIKKILESKV